MIEFTVETNIKRPVPAVFAYASDPAKLATWQTNTVSAVPETNGAFGLGTRLREVHRAPVGKEFTSLVEVSEYDPDRAFALHVLEGALPIDARLSFEATDHGTRLTFAAHGQPTGPMRFAQRLLRRSLRRQFAGYCATLKHVLENEQPTA